MKETIDTIIAWHKETFPDCTLESQLVKYSEELEEWEKADNRQDELFELADMVVVACGIMRFNRRLGSCSLQNTYDICWGIGEYDMTELWDAVEQKMEKNRNRIWQKQDNRTYHHTNKD